jgi:hypothetical protein
LAIQNTTLKLFAKIVEAEERDQVRNFQPPITGEEIMEILQSKPSKEIGMPSMLFAARSFILEVVKS